jgi:hypothetical protein
VGVLFDMQAFYRLLDAGSDEQLRAISLKLQAYIDTGNEAETLQEARWLLRQVEASLLQRIFSSGEKSD